MKRILITALGTMNCTTIVSELRKHEGFYLIGADINPRHCIATSREVDEYYQFPKATVNREEYFEFVKDFCQEHKVDIYFCVVDEEVETMAKHREELNDIGVRLCVANTDAVVICHNKDKFAEWSERNIPEYTIRQFKSYEEIQDSDFPLFIKPIEGRASIGCRRIVNKSEFVQIRNEWKNYVVQECIDEKTDIVAVDIVRNKKTGQVEIAQRLELMRNSNGCGVAVEIVDIPEVKNACLKIAELLDINGVVNTEFFITDNGPKIIEVNPRLPAGIAYSCMAGLDVVMNSLRIAEGEPCIFSPIKVGSHYAKRYETYEI